VRYSQVCTHKVHAWALESGKAGGIGANSSWYGGCSAHLRQARHSCCSQRTHRSACVELEVSPPPEVDRRCSRTARHMPPPPRTLWAVPFFPTPKVSCKYNSFGVRVGSANPSKHAPLRKKNHGAPQQLYALQACTDVSSSSACLRPLSCSALALPSMPVRAAAGPARAPAPRRR
jgi:hypothetical protein